MKYEDEFEFTLSECIDDMANLLEEENLLLSKYKAEIFENYDYSIEEIKKDESDFIGRVFLFKSDKKEIQIEFIGDHISYNSDVEGVRGKHKGIYMFDKSKLLQMYKVMQKSSDDINYKHYFIIGEKNTFSVITNKEPIIEVLK